MKPRLHWIQIRRRSFSKPLTKLPRVAQQLLSPIVYPPSRMLIACESYFSGHVSLPDNIISSYFLKEGCVSEAGTHDELLSLRGDYYEYVQLQALNK